MYVTMWDASKAFDKVNHSKLFTKLIVFVLCAFFITGAAIHRWCQNFTGICYLKLT